MEYDYYVALITVTATEEEGLRHIYKDWKPLFLEGDDQKYYEAAFELPENIKKEDAKAILEKYLKVYSADDDKDIWFSKIKDLCEPLGFTPNVKEFKKNPELFKGHVGDVSTVIRLAVTSRKNTPDLCSIMSLLGQDKVNERINGVINTL